MEEPDADEEDDNEKGNKDEVEVQKIVISIFGVIGA
jgi:hypothetical protein